MGDGDRAEGVLGESFERGLTAGLLLGELAVLVAGLGAQILDLDGLLQVVQPRGLGQGVGEGAVHGLRDPHHEEPAVVVEGGVGLDPGGLGAEDGGGHEQGGDEGHFFSLASPRSRATNCV